MVSSRLKLLAFIATITLSGLTTVAEAQYLLMGRGIFRPYGWPYYNAGMGYNSGIGFCGSSCGGCDTGGCCGVQSYYGPSCDSCGGGGCGSACGSCGTASNCCSQFGPVSSDPVPEGGSGGSSTPGVDNFNRTPGGTGSGGSSIPRSSIPPGANPGTGATDPSTNWAPGSDYGSGRTAPDYLNNNSGGNAPEYVPPRTNPSPAEPFEPSLDGTKPINIEIDPLEIDTPVAVTYQANRERVRLWSTHRLPQVAARVLPTVEESWQPNRVAASMASR